MKKPSIKGMKNTKYLGHFCNDKYIQKGHNDSGKIMINGRYDTEENRQKRRETEKYEAEYSEKDLDHLYKKIERDNSREGLSGAEREMDRRGDREIEKENEVLDSYKQMMKRRK